MNQYMSSILILLFVFSFHGVIVNAEADLVGAVCTKAATTNPSLTYHFCSSALEANPNSDTSDIFGLGEISMELSLLKAANVTSSINNILKDGKVSPDLNEVLVACSRYYANAASNVQSAISAFKGKDFVSAGSQMASAMEEAQNCEDGFETGLDSPVEKDFKDFIQLTFISYTITGMN